MSNPVNPELVVVVGAGPGVGAAVAHAFAEKGHPILLIARNIENLEEIAAGLRILGSSVTTAVADASLPNDVARVIEKIEGPIDALVYNAAAFGGPLLATETEEVRLATEVNLYSLLSATQAALPKMQAGRSALLVTGGGFALYPSSAYGVLSVGKAMIRVAALLLAQELKAAGIRVATITIGGTVAPATPFAPEIIAKKYVEAFENREGEVETIFTGETI
jgi:NADP-dependent 3-hydroxy acid dehydrogenase YdfG